MEKNLDKHIAIVTGASRGIGRAIAMELARQGATVIGTATSESGAAAISEAFNVQFRFSAYNVLNRVNRSLPNGDINNATDFGRDTSEQRRRQMEFSLKLIF